MPRGGTRRRNGHPRPPRGPRSRSRRDLRGRGRVLAPGRLYAGSSGFSYSSWKGDFYPADARPEDFLRLYSLRLPSVELNSTFYRLPAEEQFERWAEQTPPGFRFAVTLARRLTSFGRVEGMNAAAQAIGRLGERLGPVRIKVAQARDDGFLRLLLDSLDPEMDWALDFRHPSWFAPEIEARVDSKQVARVGALEGGARFRYLRLREPPYDDATLAETATRIQPLLAEGLDVYLYFQHEDEPTAPRYAERLLELVSDLRA
ncbi:MAG: DUF72 domain-containing protein [Gaiellaceae bacterium]